jgi:hypothetical protein
MRFKSLFLGMLGAAVFVGCNNESPIGGSEIEEGATGISTSATFELKFAVPGTYAGDADRDGTAAENVVNDVALVIYKLDGTPEAIGYLTSTDFNTVSRKFTLKCYSGEKLIYLAANLGGDRLVSTGLTASNALDPYIGLDWTDPANAATRKTFAELNSPIWGTTTGPNFIAAQPTLPPFTGDPTLGAYVPTGATADTLIQALSGGGTFGNGVLFPRTTVNDQAFLMTNWGDASQQTPDDGGGAGTTYASTCKFTLKPAISADDSRNDPASPTNAGKNALLINIQRALAKVVVRPLASTVLSPAGEGSNAGVFVPEAKWAAGNINRSTYPFQQYEGSIIKSTRYADTAAIVPFNTNQNWDKKIDNTRWIPAGQSYAAQNLTVNGVITTLGGAKNVNFNDSIYLTENNNANTLDAYTTFILFAGRYRPASYIAGVNNTGNITTATAFPTEWTAGTPGPTTNTASGETNVDTMFFVQSFDANGLFFLGKQALRQYICWRVLNLGAQATPDSVAVTNYIAGLKLTPNSTNSDLQAYYRGYCFYRVWIRDASAASAANKTLVRRNHIYEVNITKIKGPGIGDPNDIIDPDPSTVELIEEAETYVTATINLMKWHVVEQDTEVGL